MLEILGRFCVPIAAHQPWLLGKRPLTIGDCVEIETLQPGTQLGLRGHQLNPLRNLDWARPAQLEIHNPEQFVFHLYQIVFGVVGQITGGQMLQSKFNNPRCHFN